MKSSVFGMEKDLQFMHEALLCAREAYVSDEVPIGAVVVDGQGTIIGRGGNQVEALHMQSAHAERIALDNAGLTRSDWRLDGCWLYVTLEPCAMCMALIRLSRISGVVYAATSPLFGYRLDKDEVLSVYNKNLLAIVDGVCDTQATELLKTFFQKKRNESG
jgi:tRNA(adenine34) deaminase